MNKVWLVAKTTYWQRVRSGMFVVLTFGLPVIMIISGAVPFFLQGQGDTLSVIGYVDQTGRLVPPQEIEAAGSSLTFVPYADPSAARAALVRGTIGGYLVIPADYFRGEAAVFHAAEQPPVDLEADLTPFMQRALLPDAPGWLLERLAEPAQITYVDHGNGQEISEGIGLIFQIVLPLVLAVMFALTLLTGANQMGSAIVREKDQRAMEIIVTSLSARQLVTGKVLGLTWLSLTQVSVWLAGGLVALGLLLAANPQAIIIPWRTVVWAVLLAVPGYFLYAVLAAGLGLIAGDSRQAQQLAGLLGLFGLAPLWLTGLIVSDPDRPLVVVLTLFPLTAPTVSLMRMSFGQVPTWQLVSSLVILAASLVGGIWLVGRIFQAAMLMYGQALRPRQLWQALREA